eukprot:SAG31_NODE_3884_length_3784_cov_2.194030_6_plen_127_part_00
MRQPHATAMAVTAYAMNTFMTAEENPVSLVKATGERWQTAWDGKQNMLAYGLAATPRCGIGCWCFSLSNDSAWSGWCRLRAIAAQSSHLLGVEKSDVHVNDQGTALHDFMCFTSDWSNKVRRQWHH